MKIKLTSSEGYLSNTRFTNGLTDITKSSLEGLENVDSVTVNLIEIFPHLDNQKVIETFNYSKDGKSCTVNITSYKGEDKKGKHLVVG